MSNTASAHGVLNASKPLRGDGQKRSEEDRELGIRGSKRLHSKTWLSRLPQRMTASYTALGNEFWRADDLACA